jgi:hypothetical protein
VEGSLRGYEKYDEYDIAGSTNRKYKSFSLLLGSAAKYAFHDPQEISRLESLVF